MSSFEIINEKLIEEKVIVWKIKDFTQLQRTNSQSPTMKKTIIEFTAGESLGQPSTWSLQLFFPPGKENIGLYLYLDNTPVPGKSVKARFIGSVKVTDQNSEKLFFNLETNVKEFKACGTGLGYPEFMTIDELKSIGALLNNDILTLYVKLVIDGGNNAVPVCAQEMFKQSALNQMAKHFEGLLETGEGSDFVIRVKGLDSKEYVEKKVSRVILSSQSPVFAAMLGSQMSEKETGVVTIEDLTPKGLDVLLEFIYTGNLSNDWKLVSEEIANAAEKYDFPLLKTFMDEWLHTTCTTDNALVLFSLAKQQGLLKASKNILEYIKSNLENVLTLNL